MNVYWATVSGLSIVVFALIIAIIVLSVDCNSEEPMTNVNEKTSISKLKDQPLAFKEEWLASPCKPWVGCLYPMPNPIDIQTGERQSEPDVKTCELSWRDCSAYSDCVDGQCKPKPGIYSGF